MPLEDLVCAGCGAPLETASARGPAIVCPYCSREHVFVTPPPKPSRHVRVHYEGWDESYDESVGRNRVRVP